MHLHRGYCNLCSLAMVHPASSPVLFPLITGIEAPVPETPKTFLVDEFTALAQNGAYPSVILLRRHDTSEIHAVLSPARDRHLSIKAPFMFSWTHAEPPYVDSDGHVQMRSSNHFGGAVENEVKRLCGIFNEITGCKKFRVYYDYYARFPIMEVPVLVAAWQLAGEKSPYMPLGDGDVAFYKPGQKPPEFYYNEPDTGYFITIAPYVR